MCTQVSFRRPTHHRTDPRHTTTQHSGICGMQQGPGTTAPHNQRNKASLQQAHVTRQRWPHSRLSYRKQQHWGTRGAAHIHAKLWWTGRHTAEHAAQQCVGECCLQLGISPHTLPRHTGAACSHTCRQSAARHWPTQAGRQAARHSVALAKPLLPRKDSTPPNSSPKMASRQTGSNVWRLPMHLYTSLQQPTQLGGKRHEANTQLCCGNAQHTTPQKPPQSRHTLHAQTLN